MTIKQELIHKLEDVKFDHAIALEQLLSEIEDEMTDCQYREVRNMSTWLNTKGARHYEKAQDAIQQLSDETIMQGINAILESYSKIVARITTEIKAQVGEEKVKTGLHLAEWIAGAPHRFALRLLQFDINVL